ncbi:MAG: RNA polymerase sigma factor [Candidatus Binatia bacterium]
MAFIAKPANPSPDTDIELMLRTRDGDLGAFQELFARHSESLLEFIARFIGERAEAEDLTQEAFLRVFRARERYEAAASFKSYIYRIATNLCLNECRRVSTTRTEPLESHGVVREFPDPRMPAAEELLAGKQAAKRIRAALDRLPETQRVALLLTRGEGLSCREVADILETSESAVKSLVFRATQTLRETLADLIDNDPRAFRPRRRHATEAPRAACA